MAKLFHDKRKAENQAAGDLSRFEGEAKVFYSKLEQLQKAFRVVKTKDEFDNVVKQLIAERQSAQQFLSKIANGNIPQLTSKIMAQAARDSSLKNLGSLSRILGSDIILSNEKLALQAAAMSFINALKELKPITEIIMNQTGEYARLLGEANSLEIVEQIERDILEKNSMYEGALTRLVPYPEDEEVAGELLDFLRNKPELLNILQSFALYESLETDIENAKSRLENAASLT